MLHNNKKVNLNNLFLYTLLFILILMIFWFVYDGNISNPFTSHIGPFILFIVSLGLIILLYKKDCSYKHLYNVVIGAGIFIRVWYTLWTPYNVRSHDLGNVSEDSSGHAAYIIYIFKTASLPKTNDGQFYHPPLFHALAAFIMKIFSVMHPKDDVVTMLQITRVIPCFAGCMTLILMGKICKELKLTQRAQLIIMIVMAFYPNYYLMSGRVNNDALAFFFMIFIVLYAIRWHEDKSYKNIICLALGFGLGMITKINVVMLSIPVGALFIYEFIGFNKKNKVKEYLPKYLTFCVVSFPIGLSYAIRNFSKFGQPLNYVLDLKDTLTYESPLSVKNISLVKRVLPIEWKKIFSPLYINVLDDYNIPKYIIKSSLFGEFSFEGIDIASAMLITINILLITLSLVAFVYLIVNYRKKDIKLVIGVVVLQLLWIVSYVVFNIRYPFACTMDYRYIPMTSFIGMIGIGVMLDEWWGKKKKLWRGMCIGSYVLVGLFCLLSVYCYI